MMQTPFTPTPISTSVSTPHAEASQQELRAADLKIVEAYVKVIQQEERSDAAKYLESLKALRYGNKTASGSSTPAANNPPSGRGTSGAHAAAGGGRNSSFGVLTPSSRAEGLLKEARWAGVASSVEPAESLDAVRVAKRCTAAMLDVFKELASIRSLVKQLFDASVPKGLNSGIPQHYRPSHGTPNTAQMSRPLSAKSTASRNDDALRMPHAPRSPRHPSSPSKELCEDLYAAAGRAVDTIRSNVVYTSHILNAHVTATEAQQKMSEIIKLVQEENAQIELSSHRDAEQRSIDHLNALGVRHLSAATDLLKSVPRAPAEIYQWQEAVALTHADHTLHPSTNDVPSVSPNESSLRTTNDIRVLAKAIALDRVHQKSKQLCDDLQLSLVPPPLKGSDETPTPIVAAPVPSSARRPTRPTTAKQRLGSTASAATHTAHPTIGVDGKAAARSVRPRTATTRLHQVL
jgi:hypothetical protein